MTNKTIVLALGACSLLALAGCNSGDTAEANAPAVVGTETLAALIEDEDDLSTVTTLLGDTGLQSVFDGAAAYTVFAPTNAAFDSAALSLRGEDAQVTQAAQVAILREHIVPGYFTRDDIVAAIGRSGGTVEMDTMGSNTLSFSSEGNALMVTSSDGSEARITGPGMSGANGTIFPVDGILKAMDEAG